MIADDRRPGLDRRERLARFAPSLDQPAAHHRIFDAAGAVEIPAIRRAARAAARLVIGHAGTRARIIGLLRLPGDDAALDVDLPAARTGAIHAMGRAHDLVVLPTLPVAFLPHAVFVAQFAKTIGERFAASRKIGQTLQKMAHKVFSLLNSRPTTARGARARRLAHDRRPPDFGEVVEHQRYPDDAVEQHEAARIHRRDGPESLRT